MSIPFSRNKYKYIANYLSKVIGCKSEMLMVKSTSTSSLQNAIIRANIHKKRQRKGKRKDGNDDNNEFPRQN